ncbi:putative VP4 [Microviridae sp.]|nr:putative VP4 [Microviridae sp.]
MCLYPKLIINKKYTPNKKNGGKVPPISDIRTMYVPVGCGRCLECKKQKKREWQVRLLEDIKEFKNAKFITLTFRDEEIIKLKEEVINASEYDTQNEIATLAVRRFLERWRKKFKKSIRHWLVTELGHTGTERIHLHGILYTDIEKDEIEKIWKYGYIWVGNYVNNRTINYIVKYINKVDTLHKGYNSKILCSPGIGRYYLKRSDKNRNKFNGTNTIEYYRTNDGSKLNLPTYYRNHLYTEEEREKLWLHKLDKEERYVLGQKISIKNGEDDYYKLLKIARMDNIKLGYGNDKKNFDEEQYKIRRKKIKIATKLKNSKN